MHSGNVAGRHRNSGGSVDMSDESESETDSSLADEDSNGQVRRRSSTSLKKRRWLKDEVHDNIILLLLLLLIIIIIQNLYSAIMSLGGYRGAM